MVSRKKTKHELCSAIYLLFHSYGLSNISFFKKIVMPLFTFFFKNPNLFTYNPFLLSSPPGCCPLLSSPLQFMKWMEAEKALA